MNVKGRVKSILVLIFITALLLVPGDTPVMAETSQTDDSAAISANNADNGADSEKDKAKDENKEQKELFYEVTVTATRTKKDTFEIPKAVSVVDRKKIEEKSPNNVTELLTELPGVDVNGVGANQSRPVIRGFRGQRILLMEDGIRMNNSRRQQDFGEIPSLVDISEVDRVEVVRGPASVLYGSDAIGGVVNVITRVPNYDASTSRIHGNLGYRYSSADKQNKGYTNLNGNIGKFGFMVSGNYRSAKDYTAPAGTFGDITLDNDVTVTDTGVKDGGLNLLLNYNLSQQNQFSLKYEYYHSKDAGFGLVEPDLYNPGTARIQIRYPMQEVQKYTFRYENRQLGFALADYIGLTAYHSQNERDLSMNIFIPFNMPRFPDAGLSQESSNYTNVKTIGLRLEFNKGLNNHTFTYGLDFFNDNTENTDSNLTQLIGFGPPSPSIDYTPTVPNARYRSIGAFLQDEITLFKRTSLILGVRYQNVNAKTKTTPGLEDESLYNSTDQTVVGTANLLYSITDDLRLIFSVGRGFRSPNLIERFYNGVTPEGGGYQIRNTNLKAETSLNFDVGFKFRKRNVYLEATFFNNIVWDGIRISYIEDITQIDGWEKIDPEILSSYDFYHNENVDKLRMRGIETAGRIFFNFGLSGMANFTWFKSKDLGSPETPYVDTYSSKFNLNVRYDHPQKVFWMAYDLRINGNQKDVQLGDNPLGDIIPGYTVHSISAGITLFKNSKFPQQLGIIVGNLSNTLYSEFSNASFFRPAPKRHVVLTWLTRF